MAQDKPAAAPAGTPPMPQAGPEHEGLKGDVGTWDATVESFMPGAAQPMVSKGTEITVADLPESMREENTTSAEFVIQPHRTLAEIEKMAIVQTLQRTNWNKQEAAQILGLYRPTLYSKMKKHAIEDMSRAAGRARRPRPGGGNGQVEAQS